jgi:hypothetical protein
MKLRTPHRIAAIAALLVLTAAAAHAADIKSAFDPNVDFSQIKTWRFRIEKGPGGEMVDGRARAEIRSELTKKGLRELPPGDQVPDVLVSYGAGSADTLYPDWQFDASYFGSVIGWIGSGSRVRGGVMVDMGDPKTEKTIWAGVYVMEGNNANALQVMLDRLEKAVRGALKEYPPKQKK